MKKRLLGVVLLAALPLLLGGCAGLLFGDRGDDSGTAVRSPSPIGEYLIAFEELAIPAGARAELEALGAEIKNEWPELGGLLAVSSDPDFPNQAAEIDGVKEVGAHPYFRLPVIEYEGDRIPHHEEPETGVRSLDRDIARNTFYVAWQWDIRRVGGDADTWALGQGEGAIVAVLDTGVDYLHWDIEPNYLYGKSYVPDHLHPETGIPQPAEDPRDYHGHGTHVAGSIAAPLTQGRIIGVAPRAGIANYKVMATGGYGYQEWIMDGIMDAADDGVHIINMSLGGYRFVDFPSHFVSYILYARAVQYASDRGVLVVSAAGNAAFDLTAGSSVYNAPGGTPASLSISATGPANDLAPYSNYGWQNADFAGPGGDISNPPFSYCLSAVEFDGVNHWYAWMIGTSMAAPKVAGVAAIIIGANPGIGPDGVLRIMERTARDLGPAGYDKYFGWGLAHAYRALTR